MADSHSERADGLAAQAGRALQEALDMQERGKPANALVSGAEWDRAMTLAWQRVHAIQAQAQIHATLALNDTVFRHGDSL